MTDQRAGATSFLTLGLLACLAVAVLGFGGTAPLARAVAELLAFTLFGIVLWLAEGRPGGAPLPWIGPLLLLGYIGVQTLLVHPASALVREQMLRLVAGLCVFYVALYVSRGERSRGRFIAGLVGLGLFEALYGLVQYLTGWQHIFSYEKFFYTGMATGTYINPNHFAGLLEMLLPPCLAWALVWLERSSDAASPWAALRSGRGEATAALIFFFFSALLLLAAILFSRSRTGILSAGAAAILTGAAWTASARRRPMAALAVAGLLAGGGLIGLWIGLGPVVERYESLPADYASRMNVWKDSVSAVAAHPWLGTGLGTFADAYTRVQSTHLNQVVDHAHNDYLETAAELGVPGAALAFGLILFVVARGISACFRAEPSGRRLAALGSCGGILAILIHGLTDFNLQIPANALVLAALLGVAYAASEGRSPRSLRVIAEDEAAQ